MVHQTFLAAFPNGYVTTEELIAEGEKVVERFSFRGTNTGSFMGAPATGKKVMFTGVSVFRVANGKIVEHWGASDASGTIEQLNLVPTPGHLKCHYISLAKAHSEGMLQYLHPLLPQE
jgi:predicted ester cyclase